MNNMINYIGSKYLHTVCVLEYHYSKKLQQGFEFGDLVNLGQNPNIKTHQY